MRALGVIGLLIGLLGLAWSMTFETSVAADFLGERRVHNIGLMNQKQNMLIAFGAVAVVGSILSVFGGRREDTPTGGTDTRECPFCAETVKKQAIVCKHCQRDLPAVAATLSIAEAEAESARLAALDAAKPQGTCPNCQATLAIDSAACRKCGAEFGPGSMWSVQTKRAKAS